MGRSDSGAICERSSTLPSLAPPYRAQRTPVLPYWVWTGRTYEVREKKPPAGSTVVNALWPSHDPPTQFVFGTLVARSTPRLPGLSGSVQAAFVTSPGPNTLQSQKLFVPSAAGALVSSI